MAAAVLTACLAFVVQAGIVIALVRLIRKMQGKTAGFMEKAESVLAKVEPVLDKVGPVSEKIELALDSISDAAAKFGPAIDRFRPVVDKAVVVVERTGVLIQNVNQRIFAPYSPGLPKDCKWAATAQVRRRSGESPPGRLLLPGGLGPASVRRKCADGNAPGHHSDLYGEGHYPGENQSKVVTEPPTTPPFCCRNLWRSLSRTPWRWHIKPPSERYNRRHHSRLPITGS